MRQDAGVKPYYIRLSGEKGVNAPRIAQMKISRENIRVWPPRSQFGAWDTMTSAFPAKLFGVVYPIGF